MRQTPSPTTNLERGFALAAITYLLGTLEPFLGGLRPLADPSIANAIQGSGPAQLAGAIFYGCAAIALILRFDGRLGFLVRSNPSLIAFLLLVLASLLWTASMGVSLRRIVGLFGCVVVALFLASRFTSDEVVELLAKSFAIAILVSIALIGMVPAVGGSLFEAPGGVWGHKNELGRAMVFSTLVSCAILLSSQRKTWWIFLLLCTSLALLGASRSAQAVIVVSAALIFFLPLVVLLSRSNRRFNWRIFSSILVTAATFALLVEFATDPILAAVGRDSTLTDRTLIWELVADLGWERPWLGAGYGAFWTSSAAYVFGDRWYEIDHAHNGYVDLWLELGFIGLIGFAALLVTAQVRAWNVALSEPQSVSRFFPVFLLAAMMLNAVGRVFPEHNSLYWTLLCYAAVARRTQSMGA